MQRQCSRCKKYKDISEFYVDRINNGYGNKCKPCDIITRKERKKRSPWQNHLEALRKRCNYVKHHNYYLYGQKGIKALISEQEIKSIWFRDKAFNMEKPSIDRINNKGDYTLENCRFIELKENIARSRKKPVIQFSVDNQFIKEWDSPMDVQRELGYGSSNIGNCARGNIKKAYNFIWKYKLANPIMEEKQ